MKTIKWSGKLEILVDCFQFVVDGARKIFNFKNEKYDIRERCVNQAFDRCCNFQHNVRCVTGKLYAPETFLEKASK